MNRLCVRPLQKQQPSPQYLTATRQLQRAWLAAWADALGIFILFYDSTNNYLPDCVYGHYKNDHTHHHDHSTWLLHDDSDGLGMQM